MSESESPVVKIPKGTPPWAVGIVAVVFACGGWFLAATPQINTYMQNSREVAVKRADTDDSTVKSVLELVKSNSQQITQISNELGQAQVQVINLMGRVAMLEKELNSTERQLKECEAKIALCKG